MSCYMNNIVIFEEIGNCQVPIYLGFVVATIVTVGASPNIYETHWASVDGKWIREFSWGGTAVR